jgi:hypothetical protein
MVRFVLSIALTGSLLLVATAGPGLAQVPKKSTDPGPARPRSKFEVDFRIQVSQELDKQVVLAWINLLKELGASGISQVPGTPALPRNGEKVDSPFQAAGANRVQVNAMLGPSGNLFIGTDGYRVADRSKLAALIRAIQSDGVPGPDPTAPMWGLGRAQVDLLQVELKSPSRFDLKDRPFDAFMGDLRDRVKLDIQVSPEAQTAAKSLKLNAATGELSLGCALAYVLGQHGLAWEPRQSKNGTVAVLIMPRENSKRPWPVGLAPEQLPGNIAPNLMVSARYQTTNTPLREVLDAFREQLKMDVLLDSATLAERDVNPDKLTSTIQIPSGTFASAIRKTLNQMGLKYELRIDEGNRAFLWVTVGEPTGPVKKNK